ncbi:uncharacterized protein [Onthophagus taurus]|uniref:uncharacterized protein n=1 Tax=Onthophagus taurus TaxID=166361 RepID=UPI0039BEA092
MFDIVTKIIIVTLLNIKFIGCFRINHEMVDSTIKKWAPLIIFHPEEKFFPLSVEEYLEHVYPANSDGTPIKNDFKNDLNNNLPIGRSSHGVHLTTRMNLDDLKSSLSFLNGRNPDKFSVPSYVIVNECGMKKRSRGNFTFIASYWFFFPYNEGKKVCFLGSRIPVPFIPVLNKCLGVTKKIGNHVGDFEHITISFNSNYEPIELFASTHDIGAYYSYDLRGRVFRYKDQRRRKTLLKHINFPAEVRLDRNRPVLYAARGSHGLWGDRGRQRYYKLPNLYDYTGYGVVWRTWEDIQIYHLKYSKQPDWMQFIGKWGNPRDGCLWGLCELSDAPNGIVDRPVDFEC